MTLKVLLIEDSPDDAELLRYELISTGYDIELLRVETEADMRSALSHRTWDIVISDFMLPRFDGEKALRVLQESGVDIPFIVVSGAIGEERAVDIMRAGAHDYVMKDNLQRLVPVIQRELREAAERQARRAAEEQVSKLSRALEQSASLVMITDTDGVIEYINPAFTHITGYTPYELIGVHSRVLQSGVTPKTVYDDMWRTILAGNTWRSELQNKKKNGELYWTEITVSAVRNIAGEIVQFLSVQEDVSERKRLEEELRQHNEQLEQMVQQRTRELQQAKDEIELILDSATDAIALAQPNGDIRAQNPSFTALFGETVSKNIERILWAALDEQHMSTVGNALIKTIYERTHQQVEARISIADGTSCDVHLAFSPVPLDNSNRPGILVSVHDITEMKEIERFKERFVADAVHDLATPIAGLSTRLYLLKKSPERMGDHLRALDNQVEHLRQLLNDLRTLSQLDRGRLSLSPEQCDINQLARRVFDTYEPVAINKQQNIELNIDGTLPEVQLDGRLIERVLVNLVSNAINYTPKGKTVRIRTARQEDKLVLSVSDEGIGISKDELPHIFDRFYRTDRARKTADGTGLGLAITKQIVDMHTGTIHIASEVEKGTIITIYLPLVSESAGEQANGEDAYSSS